MINRHLVTLAGSTLIASSILTISVTAGFAADVKIEKCRLEVAGQTLKPIKVYDIWKPTFYVGNDQYRVYKNRVEKYGAKGRKPKWTAQTKNTGINLYRLADDGETAYFGGFNTNAAGKFIHYETPPRIHCLNLKSGKWLKPLTIAPKTHLPIGAKPDRILSVLPGNGDLAVLITLSKIPGKRSYTNQTEAFHLIYFGKDLSKPEWSKTFKAEGFRKYTGSFVWGIQQPPYAASDLTHLSWMDDKLIVCAEAIQPIYCLSRSTGNEIWHKERLWEFRRGFVGPSCYSHYISRFGLEHWLDKDKPDANKTKDFNKRFTCALTGGPAIISLRNTDIDTTSFSGRRGSTYSIFTTVAKGPAGKYSGHLSDAILYEMNEKGEVISIANLPQMPNGSVHQITDDGIVWKCDNSTFIKVAPATKAPVVQMGGGSSDGISRISWLRRIKTKIPEAWLVIKRSRDITAFNSSHAFCITADSYVKKSGDRTYHFPVSIIELNTGMTHDMALSVSVSEPVQPPSSNYSTQALSDGSVQYITHWHRGLNVRRILLHDTVIEFIFGLGNKASSATFDLSDISFDKMNRFALPPLTKTTKPKDLSCKALSVAAASGTDQLKALLKAGADCRSASKNG